MNSDRLAHALTLLVDEIRAEVQLEMRTELDARLGQLHGSLLTEKQAAQMLAVSRETMRQMRITNRIEAIYIGSAVRYSRRAVDEFVAKRTARRGLRKAS